MSKLKKINLNLGKEVISSLGNGIGHVKGGAVVLATDNPLLCPNVTAMQTNCECSVIGCGTPTLNGNTCLYVSCGGGASCILC